MGKIKRDTLYTLMIRSGGSRLFTRETYKLLQFLFYARLSRTPICWNHTARRWEVLDEQPFCGRAAQALSDAYTLTTISILHHVRLRIPGRLRIMTFYGFAGLVLFITGLLSLLCIFCITTHIHDTAVLVNAIVRMCNAYDRDRARERQPAPFQKKART